jgi:hypothetical protein
MYVARLIFKTSQVLNHRVVSSVIFKMSPLENHRVVSSLSSVIFKMLPLENIVMFSTFGISLLFSLFVSDVAIYFLYVAISRQCRLSEFNRASLIIIE